MNRLQHWLVPGVAGIALMGLVGCAAERPENVPKSAAMTADGRERIAWTATDTGQVWVTDEAANAIVYSGRVNRGDRLVVDTVEDMVSVNGVAVVTRDLPLRDHRVYFEPGILASPAARVDAPARVASDRPAVVPGDAVMVGAGKERVQFTAPGDGDVWVVDASNRELIYSGRVLRDDVVMIDHETDTLTVSGRSVLERKADFGRDTHEIYFRRGVIVPVSPASPRAPVIVEPGVRVPAGALVQSDSADRTQFVATEPGTVWVVNARTSNVVYSTPVLRGDVVTVNPATGKVTLNGSDANVGVLSADRYRVMFQTAR